MAKDIVILANGEYYHVYNRGVDKREVFLDKEDNWKFFDCLRDLNNSTSYEMRLDALGLNKRAAACTELRSVHFRKLGKFLEEQDKLVDVVSYSLNPNHFHLILKQIKDNGVSNFMHKVGTSFTNYFNKKYNRSGVLFQGAFKKIHIDSNDYLLWLLGYVNGNIEIHGLNKASDYQWSSYQAIWKELPSFQMSNLSALSGLDILLSQFKSPQQFKEHVEHVVHESSIKKEMKKYILEAI